MNLNDSSWYLHQLSVAFKRCVFFGGEAWDGWLGCFGCKIWDGQTNSPGMAQLTNAASYLQIRTLPRDHQRPFRTLPRDLCQVLFSPNQTFRPHTRPLSLHRLGITNRCETPNALICNESYARSILPVLGIYHLR